ncbi:MAG: M81 family metallopeptidase [Gemmatimonadetes bacterium]|nr:M81 family metallopeptidase [Gemmatimonadota bacterium]
MRVVTGIIAHETSTFTTVETTRRNYQERYGGLRGSDILKTFRGANKPTGGFIEGAEAHGFELIPTIVAEPHPSGPTPRALFDEIVDEMLEGFRGAGPIDGVLLELHGAMVAEGIDDGEGYILSAVRDLVGDVPIVGQLDIHSNMTPLMIEQADVLIGRESYPEVDMAPRGRECADVLVRILREGLQPTMALHQIPMVWGMNQVTAHSPMKEAIDYLHEIESRPGVVCGSIATCFPLADIPHMGASVYIVTDDDRDMAQRYADELGAWLYDRRADWHYHMPSTRETLERVHEEGMYPAVLADRNDNTGGGSPGDSTSMLRTFIEAGLEDACVLYIVDPEAVDRCMDAGVGATVTLDVGGKSTPLQGKPVTMTAEVLALSDGRFRYHGPMLAGLEGTMGPSAHIRQEGVHVILVNEREQPFDTAFSESLGLDPKEMRYIGVKSSAHFRAGFEPWAGAIHVVTEPGVHDAGVVTYHRLGRKLYPLDGAQD